MLARIIIGLGITVVCFAIAGRRFFWLSKLIRSGQPAKRPFQGFAKAAEAEVVEVAGQKKLLQWTIPGLAHFFTMWGFTVLLLTIIEAYGALFNRDFAIPLIGHWSVIGFIEDFFSAAVLISLVVFSIIRIKNAPAKKQRQSRFYGSHTGAAWIVLGLIALVIITLVLYRAAQINTGHFPYQDPQGPKNWWPFFSQGLASLLHPLGTGVNSVIEVVFLLANVAVIAGFMVFVSYSKHLHIFMAPINVGTSRRPRALGGLDKTPDMDMENVTEDTVFGVGKIEDFTWKQMLDFATCTECGRCQSVCPAWNTDKPLSPKLLIMGLRDNMFASADRLLSKDSDAAAEAETQHYFDTIEANLKAFSDENGSLKKELSSLKAHNETLLHALRTGTRVLSFSAEGAISPVTGKDGKVHEFEQKVAEVEKEGKSRAKAFEAVRPIGMAFARAFTLLGDSGAGQLAKMVNQICIAGLVQALSEGVAFGQKAGLDMVQVLDVIGKGAAQSWQMDNRGKTMVADKFDFGFAVDWMRKDLGLVMDEAKRNGARVPVIALVDQFYADVQAMGGQRFDTSSLIKRLR